MTSIQREVLASILHATKTGETSCERIRQKARIPMEDLHHLLNSLAKEGLISYRSKSLAVSSDQRIRIAIEAVNLGADFQEVCRALGWKEFEEIASEAFQTQGFSVSENVRFKGKNGKRWEIDLLACRTPLVISVDCKHWTQNWRKSAIKKIVDSQIQRSSSLAGIFPEGLRKNPCGFNKNGVNYTVFPLVLSLFPSPLRFHHGTPIVSILQLRSFLYEIPAQTAFLTYFRTKDGFKHTELTKYL